MTIHVFDLENQYFESRDSALLPIDNLTYNDDVTIDIWGAVGEKAVVDIKEAEIHEVVINKFEVQVPNTINFKFLTKKFTIKIKELIFKCGGIHYLGGATVENLSIFSYRPEVGINSDSVDNILIQTLPHDDEEPIRQMLSGIEMIPGCGEFVYDPKRSEAARSLSELKEALPNIKWVAPVVAWFANSLDIDKCQIKPGIDRNYEGLESWQVANYFQSSAHKISVDDKNCSVYGGTINDESIVKYLMLLKESELNIIFYPLIMVDIHGKPWRGRIGALSSDQDRIKNADYIEHFFQAQYRPFILHYANLVKDKIDAFIIGSELIGLTSIHDQNKKFLFVQKLVELASEVKQILGKNVKITYAADWSEYHSVPGGLRPLDDLWGSENIDFVGIDAYFPITDSKNSRIFTEAIKKGWHSGEGYDYYTSNGARIPFQSNEPWTQWKNLSYWWNSEHWAWDDEKKESIKTPWQPKSKQIWFTEFGFPSIDKAPNKPNIFYDPKSSEGNIPTYSSGRIDNAIQLRAIRASLEFWQGSEFLEQMILWTWDARGIGWQNDREYYADGDLWQYGHWLDSKIAYRHLEVGGDIKGVKNLIIKSKSLCLCVNLEVEDIFIEVENSIGISNKIHIGNNAFLKCNDLSINGDINGKALFIEALDTYVNYNIHSLELLCIKGKTLNIGQIDLRIAEIIINLTDCLIISNPSITSHRVENDDGGKTVTTIHNQSITRHTIEAIRAEFIVGGNFSIPPSIINIRELFIEAGELSLEAITTDHKMETVFTGKKDWKEDRQKWTEVKFAQTAHAVKLNADKLAIIVKNNFNAKASKITANELSMEAENYGFQGKNLDNYIIKDGHTKRGVFAPQKSFHGEHRHASIEGVKIVVSGQAYMIAHGQIWLRASGISAGQLAVEANKIILEGLVGSDYHSMSVTKKGTRLALTCNTKEISGGVEVYKECSRTQQYQEYLIPSILQGRESLQIEAGSLHQHGSILSGKSGKIKADSWTASAPTLTQSYSESIERISAGATIGIRQNISSAIEGLQNTGNAISNYDSNNNFAALNLASNMYSNFRALTNLAAGNVVNAGVWLSVSSSSSSTRSSIITHALSQADFEELEVTVSGRINGTLEINAPAHNISASSINLEQPVDEHHHSHRQTSISIGTGGFTASHYQEKNGEGFGAGYSTSFDSTPSIFGPEISVQYSSGRNHLDVNYASMDTEKVAEAWSGGLEGILNRMIDNVVTQTERLYNLVSSPMNIVDEVSGQLSSAAEVASATLSNILNTSSTSSAYVTIYGQDEFDDLPELIDPDNPNDSPAEPVKVKTSHPSLAEPESEGSVTGETKLSETRETIEAAQSQELTEQQHYPEFTMLSRAEANDNVLPLSTENIVSANSASLFPTIRFSSVAQAFGAPLVNPVIEIPIFELGIGSAMYGARHVLSRSLPIAGVIVTVEALNNAAKFESNHIWLNEDYHDWLNNPLISQKTKDQMFSSMLNDRLLAKTDECEEYSQQSEILEKRKHQSSNKSKEGSTKLPDLGSQMPDPDDFEPDDENKDFDPQKKDNYDKIKRDARFGKLYRDAKNSKVWYSKERSGDRAHGGEHWKRFIEKGEDLVHDADVDTVGKIMSKHKSFVGIKIKIKDLIGIK